jgi:hypothetical protein
MGLDKLEGAGVWSVCVAKGLFVQARKQRKSLTTLSVPALLADLVHLSRAAKSAGEVEAIVRAASASSLFGFTVLVFLAASDEEETRSGVKPSRKASDIATAAAAAAAVVAPHDAKLQPYGYEVVRAETGQLVPVEGDDASAPLTAVSRHPVEAALGVVGHLQRNVTGLDEASESAFCASLVRSMNEMHGHTWHAFLAPAPHKSKLKAAATAEVLTAEAYTLGGLVPEATVLEVLESPAHCPAYEVTWDAQPHRVRVAAAVAPGTPAGDQGAHPLPAEGQRASMSPKGALVHRGVRTLESALQQRGDGKQSETGTVSSASARHDGGSGGSGGSGSGGGLQDVRYLELTLRSLPLGRKLPPLPPSSGATGGTDLDAQPASCTGSAAGSGAGATPAAPGPFPAGSGGSSAGGGKTPEHYHLILFRTTQAYIDALHADAPGAVAALGRPQPAAATRRRATCCVRALDATTLLLGAVLAAAVAGLAWLHLRGGAAGCVRPGEPALPWDIALLTLLCGVLPPAAGVALGVRNMLPQALAATLPHLWPGGVVPMTPQQQQPEAAAPPPTGVAGAISALLSGALGGVGPGRMAHEPAAPTPQPKLTVVDPAVAGLPVGCTLVDALHSELLVSQRAGLMCLAVSCLALVALLHLLRRRVQKSGPLASHLAASDAAPRRVHAGKSQPSPVSVPA